MAAEPVVKGPVSVSDWYQNGQQFIADSKKVFPNARKAKNVILFVGDGMGISTVTASRILEGQMKGQPGEENRLFFETLPYLA
ncbi:alkaline phosphatase, partial [Acinetobacter baumannii]